jgi:hypothetical protein
MQKHLRLDSDVRSGLDAGQRQVTNWLHRQKLLGADWPWRLQRARDQSVADNERDRVGSTSGSGAVRRAQGGAVAETCARAASSSPVGQMKETSSAGGNRGYLG